MRTPSLTTLPTYLPTTTTHGNSTRLTIFVQQTSSKPEDGRFDSLRAQHVTVRYNNFDDPQSLEHAFTGCDKLFLVSTPHVEMDFDDAPLWKGREAHHRAAIDAAVKVGVKHIYYTSLAFGSPSKASVMRAHIRTEKYLNELAEQGKVDFTVIREGLYNESWPLYFGYYDVKEGRREVVVAGDGRVSWTSIDDMAFATAKIVGDSSEKWRGKTLYLSQSRTWSLDDLARIVSRERREDVVIKIVSRKEFEDYYADEKKKDRRAVEWWSSTYDALKDGECAIRADTLETILREAGRKPKDLDGTIREMISSVAET